MNLYFRNETVKLHHNYTRFKRYLSQSTCSTVVDRKAQLLLMLSRFVTILLYRKRRQIASAQCNIKGCNARN